MVIPLFRDREHFDRALDSVLGQSLAAEAVVLVWDGGDRETLERARERQGENPGLIQLIEQENRGLGAARNSGIRSLNTEWIALLDADDFWHLEKLEISARFLAEHPEVDFAFHAYQPFDSKAKRRVRAVREVPNAGDLIARGNPMAPSAVLFRKRAFDRLGGFLEGFEWLGVEDLDFWARGLREGLRFGSISRPLTAYRLGGMSSQLEEHLDRVELLIQTRAELWGLSPEQKEAGLRRKRYEKARALHAQSRFDEAVKAYSECAHGPRCALFRLAAMLRIRL